MCLKLNTFEPERLGKGLGQRFLSTLLQLPLLSSATHSFLFSKTNIKGTTTRLESGNKKKTHTNALNIAKLQYCFATCVPRPEMEAGHLARDFGPMSRERATHGISFASLRQRSLELWEQKFLIAKLPKVSHLEF
jgi:hypothetical protein